MWPSTVFRWVPSERMGAMVGMHRRLSIICNQCVQTFRKAAADSGAGFTAGLYVTGVAFQKQRERQVPVAPPPPPAGLALHGSGIAWA